MAKEKPKRVTPQILKGFRDYSPKEQIAREEMLGKVREVFELMGFLPLQTPSLEFAQTLLGPHYSPDSLAELFGFLGPDKVEMALRYEFTISLARYVASQPNLPLPFRRYQYGNVWRVDKPGPGRYREFMQFDIDIVGTNNILADAEIIAAMVTTFDHLGVRNFKVRFSNRKILNGILRWAGVPPDKGPDVLRVIDKLEKQGEDAVLRELGSGRIDSSGDKIIGLELQGDIIARLDEFLSKPTLEHCEQLLSTLNHETESPLVGIEELRKIEQILGSLEIDYTKYSIDPTIVRGLGYYTGPVFETTLLDMPDYGSVFSGGRYDNLISRFSSQPLSGVGASIGIDRLLAALIELKALSLREATSSVLVTIMEQDKLAEYLKIVQELRSSGIASEIYVGETKNLTKQIKYADKVGIPFAVMVGSDEFAANTVTIKNLKAGGKKSTETEDRSQWLAAEGVQEQIPRSSLVTYLKSKLAL
ncbi:MAG: histidine--tRNA ligase [candidate division Zixibacteria bacterium]|nr:histidine--tRNA ligase [candidate division Zixibacteria bacterium]